MAIKITKNQEWVNDVPKEAVYTLRVELKNGYADRLNVLSLDDLKEIVKVITDLIK